MALRAVVIGACVALATSPAGAQPGARPQASAPRRPSSAPGAPASANTNLARGEPVELTARGGLDVNLRAQHGTARGDVIVRRGDVTICCDTAEAWFEGDRVERVECRGRVVIRRADGTLARADVAVFDAGEDRVTLTGAARVRSLLADLEGESIVYELTHESLTVTGKQARAQYSPRAGRERPQPERSCPEPRALPRPRDAGPTVTATSAAAVPARPGPRSARDE